MKEEERVLPKKSTHRIRQFLNSNSIPDNKLPEDDQKQGSRRIERQQKTTNIAQKVSLFKQLSNNLVEGNLSVDREQASMLECWGMLRLLRCMEPGLNSVHWEEEELTPHISHGQQKLHSILAKPGVSGNVYRGCGEFANRRESYTRLCAASCSPS